ncbi:hypothetical protein [Niallia sp.]|uniref:Uncharacterized protein n=1 Tax=Ureibacillus massiliensis 4400831 = CIP 108448 = CCUG 49529 TaxID=1211035 RepID=A0A0A3JS92_9BACL|nr:hypothetical protein [Niallia sp.]KGR89862.1 hypothetical protein CD30_14840 [Ureibacillus massiliensis 4400831 = CIP 108448 = CCUG 49529]
MAEKQKNLLKKGERLLAFERNKKSSNPSLGKEMSVADMSHPILKENKKALALLDEIDKRKFRFFRRKADKKL